ncbi:helix-turn-helix domain-containing protein [Streptomyces sp. MnatMP-M17]|uniref:helix-turn-helix domain-containing protein n=1 Tax=unclassified Streptomyces TaxID=2593676 RepID=UPI00081D63C7|nr:helix-turn-helix domain-containing protein [Streptomyces sp. MnatMP-M17]MYZ36388.1 helix-turn-helix domain-containing protein [Streptomyces sp. SID4917]SCF83193.1 Helix-turn-helix domain-containing protein [Streptomyces sp. MnatMP-M17]
MLRIHFTDADLARTRIAASADPLWEIVSSLHRFQTRKGRWAYTDWYHSACSRIRERGLEKTVRSLLIPVAPRAAYYPDFLTPAEGSDGLKAGLAAILGTSGERVRREVQVMARVSGAPAWTSQLAETEMREELVKALRSYHEAVIAPHSDRIQAHVDAERSLRTRPLMDHGTDGLLRSLRPTMEWNPPVLHIQCAGWERDLYLEGRGLLLVPSYFCWHQPVALADHELSPVVVYPILRQALARRRTSDAHRPSALETLIGQRRAAVLRATGTGATTGGLARAAGISVSAASQHTRALRDAGLITSRRVANSVLHTLTPLGATLISPPSAGEPSVGEQRPAGA